MTIHRLRQCVQSFTVLADRSSGNPEQMIADGKPILRELISHDDWLPEFAAEANNEHYRQYLLHCDPAERFSIVSFVWGPGQKTPIHDHTVWGLVGMLRGKESSTRYARIEHALVATNEDELLPGEIDVVSPDSGDIHLVKNGMTDQPSISIHVYGANIAGVDRSVFDPKTGKAKPFRSQYNNSVLPNIWAI
jgi:3-mercaptopropionate dioxygenase